MKKEWAKRVFLRSESLSNISDKAINTIHLLTILVFSAGLSAGFLVSVSGFELKYQYVRTMFLAFLLALGATIALSIWLFACMKKNHVLKSDWLFLALIAPLYLLIAVAAISAIFTVKTTIISEGVAQTRAKVFYPLFIMLPLGLANSLACYYSYLKPLILERNRRSEEKMGGRKSFENDKD